MRTPNRTIDPDRWPVLVGSPPFNSPEMAVDNSHFQTLGHAVKNNRLKSYHQHGAICSHSASSTEDFLLTTKFTKFTKDTKNGEQDWQSHRILG